MKLILTAACCVLAAAAPTTQPWQVHLAYAGSDVSVSDGMTISWATNDVTATSTVRYGTTTALGQTATGESVSYLPAEARGEARWHHHVTLSGLAANTAYYFVCGDASGGWSGLLNFTTAPEPGQDSVFPFSIPVYGDMGVVNSAQPMADVGRVLSAAGSPFIWHVGDISYADDAFLHLAWYEDVYNEWMSKMSEGLGYMLGRPYMVNPGNHEAECHAPDCIADGALDKALGNFSAFNARWRMPFAASGSTSSMWYSFRYGSVHFLNIDSETDFPGSPNDAYASKNGGFGDQLAWVEADLARAAADRAAGKVSWILAGGHRPMYSRNAANAAGRPTSDTTPAFQAAFEPLFHKYGVDLYVAGHEHSYESIWPVFNSTLVHQSLVNPPYTTYVVTGAAGNVEGHTSYANDPRQPWDRVSIDNAFGISQLTLHNRSALSFTFRDAAKGGAVIDSWTLVRQH